MAHRWKMEKIHLQEEAEKNLITVSKYMKDY